MRWWKWAAGTIVVGALLALVTIWGLREANVIQWGAVEQDSTDAQFIVVNRHVSRTSDGVRACITYSAPGGPQDYCQNVRFDDDGEIAEGSLSTGDCWYSAVIGEPLPDCWR